MKIESNPLLSATLAADSNKQSRAASKASGSQQGVDTVKLGAGEKTVEVLKAKLDKVPEVRQDRVAALKEAIAKGTYQVDSDDVASAMLADNLDSLHK